MKKEKIFKEIRAIFYIVFILLIFRTTLFEPFHIPSGSMLPTLDLGDFILVDKTAYGIKLPFTEWFKPIYLTAFKNPSRGDVIVFKYPKDTSMNFVKRVIGLPGEEVEIKNKEVFINGIKMVANQFNGEGINTGLKFQDLDMRFFKVSLEKRKFNIQLSFFETPKDNVEKIKIPPDHFFVLGDNRDFSMDSRFWGLVPKDNIKGRAFVVWLSMRTTIFEDEFRPQFYRIGTVIE